MIINLVIRLSFYLYSINISDFITHQHDALRQLTNKHFTAFNDATLLLARQDSGATHLTEAAELAVQQVIKVMLCRFHSFTSTQTMDVLGRIIHSPLFQRITTFYPQSHSPSAFFAIILTPGNSELIKANHYFNTQ